MDNSYNTMLKNHGIKLLPFVISIICYFSLVRDEGDLTIGTMLKCAPILSLKFYVLNCISNFSKACPQLKFILMGLIFSCIGDILLNIDQFQFGMLTFGLAQLCYIKVFGWRPLKLKIGLILYAISLIPILLIYKKLDKVLIIGLPVYAFTLATQGWRSLARAQHTKHHLRRFCAYGSISFLISDTLIAIDMFLLTIPFARIWIMITYYLAQFAITISIVNEYCPTIMRTPSKKKKNKNN